MTTYYVRDDGEAGNKFVATGPETDPSRCMPVVIFENANGTFVPGDIIVFSGLGGPIVGPITFIDSGEESSVITIQGSNSPLVTRVDTGKVWNFRSIEWVYVKDINISSTYTAGHNQSVVVFSGACGTESDDSVIFENVNLLANGKGDGFNQNSGGSGHVKFIDCDVTDCGYLEPTKGNQGYSAHEAAQRSTITGGTLTRCAGGFSNVGGSTRTVTGATITDCTTGPVIKTAGAGTCYLNDCTIINSTGGKLQFMTDVGDIASFNNCDITMSSAGGAQSTVVNGTFYMTDCSLSLTDTAFYWNANTGTLIVRGCDVSITNSSGSGVFESTGGLVVLEGNTFDGTGHDTDARFLYGNSGAFRVVGNVFKEFYSLGGTSREKFDIRNTSDTDTRGGINNTISNNVFYNSLGPTTHSEMIIDTSPNVEKGTIVKNNIFYGIENPIVGDTGGMIQDYNCYHDSGAVHAKDGGNSFIDDPLFVNVATGDFNLQQSSPCVGTGIKHWGNDPRPYGENGEPYPDTKIDIGAIQSTWDPKHPSNL